MLSSVQQFFVGQALHLRHGRFDLMARPYSVPLVLILPDDQERVSILPSREAIKSFFRAKFDGLEAAGIDYLRAAVSGMDQTSSSRVAAKVSWHYVAPDGSRRGETRARYYLSRRSGGFVVEMIEFEELAFSAIVDWIGQSRRRVPFDGLDPI